MKFPKTNKSNAENALSFRDRRFLRKQLRRSKKNPYFTVPSESLMRAPMINLRREPDGMGGTIYYKDNATLDVEITNKYLREHSIKTQKIVFSVLAATVGFFYKLIVDWKDELFDIWRCLFSKAGS